MVYVIRDPLGPSPSMVPVAGHDWTDEEREEVGEFGMGPAGDGRRDGRGVDAKFYCICDIMLDSRVRRWRRGWAGGIPGLGMGGRAAWMGRALRELLRGRAVCRCSGKLPFLTRAGHPAGKFGKWWGLSTYGS